jgi:hypothetical protein
MQEIIRTNYQIFEFDINLSLLRQNWLPQSESMSEEEYKKEQLLMLEQIQKYLPQRMLINLTSFTFLIDPQLQAWNAAHIIPYIRAQGLKKAAFVMSSDFIAQLSVEQANEEGATQSNITQYFDSETTALEWLTQAIH